MDIVKILFTSKLPGDIPNFQCTFLEYVQAKPPSLFE